MAEDGAAFVLLLEDVSPVLPISQLTGCTPDQAALAVEQASALHGASWDDPGLLAQPWLHQGRELWKGAVAGVADLVTGFRSQFADVLEDEYLRLGDELSTQARHWLALLERPRCLWHGDFRLDNMGFGVAGGVAPVVVYDWQVVSLGPPTVDVSFFLGSGLTVADRRAHESDLVRLYHQGLVCAGVADNSLESCWLDYRVHALCGVPWGTLRVRQRAAQRRGRPSGPPDGAPSRPADARLRLVRCSGRRVPLTDEPDMAYNCTHDSR